MKSSPNLLSFVRKVRSFIFDWDGRYKLTRMELESIQAWWQESHDCCPEAIAMDIRFVYPDHAQMRELTKSF